MGVAESADAKVACGGVIMAVGYIGMNIDLPLYVGQGCAALPFYAAGKYAYPYMKKLLASKTLLVAGGMAMLAYCCGYASLTIVPQGEGLYAPFYLIALFSMLLVFSPFLYVSSMLQGQKWLGSLGKQSLGIMLLHAPMCHTAAVMLNRIFDKGSLLWVCCFLVAYVLVVFVAYKLTVLMERYCPVLLGKRRAGC